MSMTPAQKAAFHMRKHEIDAAIAACTNEGDYAVLTGELARRAEKRRVKFGRESIAAIERLDAPRWEYAPPRVDAPRYSDHGVDDVGAWPESSADLYTPPEPWPDEAYERPDVAPEPIREAGPMMIVVPEPYAGLARSIMSQREVAPAPVGRALSGFAARRLAAK